MSLTDQHSTSFAKCRPACHAFTCTKPTSRPSSVKTMSNKGNHRHCEKESSQQSSRIETAAFDRRATLLAGTATMALSIIAPSSQAAEQTSENTPRIGEVKHSDEEWKKLLAPASYRVLRQGGTELPASSPLNREKRTGIFRCGGCNAALFESSTKYESGTGWPSFTEAADNSITELPDYSIPFYGRTEVRCKRCGSHIGHVFPDGPPPTGQRYCMNGAALSFEAAKGSV